MTTFGYIAFFFGQRHELHATSLLDAKTKAIAHFKPRRSQERMVSVVLAEVYGRSVVHSGSELP